MKTIVFCPVHPTSLSEMSQIANGLSKRKDCRVVMLLPNEELLAEAKNLATDSVDLHPVLPSSELNLASATSLWHRLCIAMISRGHIPPRWLMRRGLDIYNLLVFYHQAINQLFTTLQPHSVILPDDRSFCRGFLPMVLRCCSQLNLQSIIVPISYPGGIDSLIQMESRKSSELPAKHWILERFPEQCRLSPYTNQQVPFYPIVETLLLNFFNALPKNPWTMGGGSSDWLLVEGEETRQRLIGEGTGNKKMIVTGHRSHDVLHSLRQKRNEIRSALPLDSNTDLPILVVALPQLGEHKILLWEQHWQEIRYLLETFKPWTGQVLISLHPKMKPTQYAFIESEYGYTISLDPLNQILPAADVFLATFSTTIQWAALCRIPAIVVDFYDFNYTDYDDYAGVDIYRQKSSYELRLKELMNQPEQRKEMQRLAETTASLISPFDGKCTQRINDFILAEPVDRQRLSSPT